MKKFFRLNNVAPFFLLTIISFPVLHGFGEIQTDTGEGIFLVNSYPYSFKDDNGFTVVIGEAAPFWIMYLDKKTHHFY